MKTKLFSLLFILLILSSISGCKPKPQPEKDYQLTLRLKPEQKVEYVLEYNYSEIVKTGTLYESWNDITIKNKGPPYRIYYWNDKYYTHILDLYPSKSNITITKELPLLKENLIGNLTISINSSLEQGQTINSIIFQADHTIKHLSYCIYRTIGLIRAEPTTNSAYCNTSSWTNYTKFGQIPNNRLICEDMIVRCDNKGGKNCNDPFLKFPINYADECYFIGKTLINENYEIPLTIETMSYFDESDYIEITAYDMDLSKNHRLLGKTWSYDWRDEVGKGVLK